MHKTALTAGAAFSMMSPSVRFHFYEPTEI